MSRGLMNLLRGSKNNWHPPNGVDTTTSSYWLNWRYFLCCLWILISVVMAFYLIMKYERPNNRRTRNGEGGDDDDYGVVVCFEDVWKPCVKAIHPIWLMVFRFGSLWSIYGCYRYHYEVGGGRSEELDEAQAVGPQDRRHPCQAAGFCVYVFQIIFQLPIAMHSTNVVFLLFETALNSLVPIGGIVALSMLWNFLSCNKTEEFSLVEDVLAGWRVRTPVSGRGRKDFSKQPEFQ
ncbi:hypothetical protein Ccrd_015303 [Cynara cardunculus var. scolymus]|uniref:Uncharacterized protein n=1 Tax=Cynara cardunculus var. scolymus TaxID=59895 RepID=A0A103YC47_CYNCS|nr:hypothetical protein Ccrd_015303 [Cynara cardunculus var. scolymus]